MRENLNKLRRHDPRIHYRGAETSRLDNLTDAVFGIAITLLIFNLANPNSFSDLLDFAKTLPAFLLSIAFLMLIWTEHARFSEVYGIDDSWLLVLNTLFVALVIFYVYPLRFLALLLTNIYFSTEIPIHIDMAEVPFLMMYFGIAVFALYFILFLMYKRAHRLRKKLELNDFEQFHTRWHAKKAAIMCAVPLLSIILTLIFHFITPAYAALIGGLSYWLYTPAMIMWGVKFERGKASFE